ncbi:hypothetical protein [Streptomyces flaveus]|uniref:hypothetical protein n=1 Tax=Streptomyces flaveus TaxID=66370 RepID=UPI0033329D3B
MTTVERLHYYNGQRLDAADLGLEQHYHLAMRRLLNRGLFTAGVVDGLEVDQPAPADTTHVVVAPGLALDPLGRELVVPEASLEDRTLAVPAQPPVKQGGYFLVLRYAEQFLPAADDPCAHPATPQSARVREQAEFVWTEDYPSPDRRSADKDDLDNAVVLAYVTLDDQCRITSIETGIRQYARPTHSRQVTAFALEGEKDIDPDNPKVLHFQVRGGTPSSVVLHLWGDALSSLHYSETGSHSHALSLTLGTPPNGLPPHTHGLSAAVTADANPPVHGHGTHDHSVWVGGSNSELPLAQAQILTSVVPGFPIVWTGGNFAPNNWYKRRGNPQAALDPEQTRNDDDESWIVRSPVTAGGEHTHQLTGDTAPDPASHTHPISGSIENSGASLGQNNLRFESRTGPRLEYVHDLRVRLDRTDITAEIIARLPRAWQTLLGNGLATHQLVTEGTDGLDLIDIANAVGQSLDTGPHTLEFSVTAGGGKVLYNLYVE